MGLALDDIRTRFDNARQQLIEEAVAVSQNGGLALSFSWGKSAVFKIQLKNSHFSYFNILKAGSYTK